MKSVHYALDGVRVIRLQNIGEGSFLNSNKAFVPNEHFEEFRRHEAKSGDLLIAGLGDEGRRLGRACLVSDDLGPAMVKADCFRVRLDQGRLLHTFAAYYLNSIAAEPEITWQSRGATRPRMNAQGISAIRIPVPHIDRQRAVVRFLDKETAEIDALIETKGRLANRCLEWKSAQLASLITECEALPKPSLRRFLISIEQGISPQCEDHQRSSDEWAVLKLSAVAKGQFVPSEHKVLPSDIIPPVRYEVRDGDLLITRANTPDRVGDVCVVKDPPPRLLLSDLIYRVELSSDALPDWVSLYLLSPEGRATFKSIARGSSRSMVKIRGADIKNVVLPMPSAGVQEDLVERASAVEAKIHALLSNLEDQISRLLEYRAALITAAVTGQLEIPEAA